ncbi:redoxin domain-containing protein [Prolixibacteraceae bacterium JC049]|nr:redoxin domain-containing protein [Prolixibacteraceae bacterium JC049]
MKTVKLLLLVIPLVFISAQFRQLQLGDKAPYLNVKMMDVSEKMIALEDAVGENGLLVMFSCNTCPFVIMWEDRFDDIKEWCDENKIGMILLNPNYGKRKRADSFEAMQKHARMQKYTFYYVLDKDSKLANSFGAQTTPHVFLFNRDMNLSYKGAIDNNAKDAEKVTKHYLKEAIFEVGAGQNVTVTQTPPLGCSIKRKYD